ncbi:MAG TPA: ribosome biogenesis GTPase Der, partial [Anaerolineales bacterium]|nr:ribosome biogenesis GTPase Der [Anaerolineales bacterium]
DFIGDIRLQAQAAIQEADAILFVVDGETGVTEPDREVADILRRMQKKQPDGSFLPPIILVVNKCESRERRDSVGEFYELGLGEPFAISAIHGTNTGDLLDALVSSFPTQNEDEEDNNIKIALVGKPNAGKSSLLNKLVGEERVIVSPIAGTTRDAIDMELEFGGLPITLIDTAGIRRRGKIEKGVEEYSVIRSFKAIERADVALLMIDATTGITSQDAHIAGFIKDEWKSCVVLVNKWDAIEKDGTTMDAYTEKILNDLNFVSYVPILYISAKTGQRVDQVLPLALRVQEERLARLTTSKINEIIHAAQDAHPHPTHAGRALKMYYGTQVRSDPPTFMIYVNEPSLMHFTYMRYLENQIRAEYGFLGTPIRIVLKGRHE